MGGLRLLPAYCLLLVGGMLLAVCGYFKLTAHSQLLTAYFSRGLVVSDWRWSRWVGEEFS